MIQRYWYQVRNYHYAGDKKPSSPPSLTFLHWLCEFVGESEFIGFIEQEFAEKKVIRVLPIPFWRQDDTKAKRMEELLAFSFREMQSDYNEPVELLTLGEPSNSIPKKLMYFEIVRLRLALSVRQKLPENVLERALGKAIRKYHFPSLY